ncbi:MAG: M24 family metallopeptidase [Thermomicrobiales bacterium]|nr:M24 family metallopeptidase [Thermomicrobiales bacterium]MCO5224742.1 M24 family metallopeptidase [Thermomicrobiales bacterium]
MAFVPQSVFADRAVRIQAWLEAQDYNALIVTTPLNFYMVTGFHLDVEPWERPVAAVFPRGAEPFLVMNELSTNHLKFAENRDTLFVRDYTIYQEHQTTYNRTFTRDQFGAIVADRLAERGVSRGTIAVEGGPHPLMQIAMPQISWANATRFLVDMRGVKYPEELAIMRDAALLTDWGQDKYMELLKPGRNVKAFDFEIAMHMMEEGARRFPNEKVEVRLFSSGGSWSSAPHGSGAEAAEAFEVGTSVVNIIIVRLNGLVVENERTLFVGQPKSDVQIRAFNAATAACEAAAAQMIAGNPVSSADAAAQRAYEDAGFGEYINHRTGHGLGIGGHEFPEDMPFLHRPFKENEVFSSEPGIYIYGVGGFRHDDTVIVGKDAPEIITRRSKTLEDQIVPV